MKRIFLALLFVMSMVCGCLEGNGTVEESTKKPINISLLEPTSLKHSISITLNSLGVYVDDYDSWGVVYGESDDRAEGTEVLAEGKPSDRKVTLKIEDLKEDTNYYIWGWADAEGLER